MRPVNHVRLAIKGWPCWKPKCAVEKKLTCSNCPEDKTKQCGLDLRIASSRHGCLRWFSYTQGIENVICHVERSRFWIVREF